MKQPKAPVDALQDAESVRAVSNYLLTHYREGGLYRLVFLAGCNTGLPASDLLSLTVGDYRRGFVETAEGNAKRKRLVIFNPAVTRAFEDYVKANGIVWWNDLVFVASSRASPHFDIKYMHRLISGACYALGLRGNWGAGAMRKTFALALYRETGSVRAVKDALRLRNISAARACIGYINGAPPAERDPPFTYASAGELYKLVNFY